MCNSGKIFTVGLQYASHLQASISIHNDNKISRALYFFCIVRDGNTPAATDVKPGHSLLEITGLRKGRRVQQAARLAAMGCAHITRSD
jgi:hypothetical protein